MKCPKCGTERSMEMTIDEAIEHCEEVAEELRNVDMGELDALYCGDTEYIEARKNDCIECAREHRQLAEWLKELKQFKEQTRWIPVSERLPKNPGRYLTYIVNEHDTNYRYIMTCEYVESDLWCWFPDDECASDNVIAWMPLPEGYKEKGE